MRRTCMLYPCWRSNALVPIPQVACPAWATVGDTMPHSAVLDLDEGPGAGRSSPEARCPCGATRGMKIGTPQRGFSGEAPVETTYPALGVLSPRRWTVR